jgi:hypothetical protein
LSAKKPAKTKPVASAVDIATEYKKMTDASVEWQNQQNAITTMQATFAKYGMTDLANSIIAGAQKGYSSDAMNLAMQSKPADPSLQGLYDAYSKRFSGNLQREAKGLPPLDPATYISTEDAYRKIVSVLPTGFYDSQSNFADFIGNNIDPSQLKERVDAAQKAIDDTDPYYKDALQSMYGLDPSHMIAHLLDPTAAAPLIERQAKAAEYGAAAARQGLAQGSVSDYEAYASGVGTGVGAEQGMAQIAAMTPGLTTLAQISNDQYNQGTAEQEIFGGLASAQRKRQQLSQQEVDRFTGRSNVASGSLNADNTGQF